MAARPIKTWWPASIPLQQSEHLLLSISLRPIRVETRKWPADPHWEFDAIWLGADVYGVWVGVPKGSLLAKPTRAFTATADHVVLIPHDDWWLATFYGTDVERPFDVYVDITTPAEWVHDELVVAVDLDLDVARRPGGLPFVDDEDEFLEHQVSLGYPPDVINSAEATTAKVLAAVEQSQGPFGGVHLDWLTRLRHKLNQH